MLFEVGSKKGNGKAIQSIEAPRVNPSVPLRVSNPFRLFARRRLPCRAMIHKAWCAIPWISLHKPSNKTKGKSLTSRIYRANCHS